MAALPRDENRVPPQPGAGRPEWLAFALSLGWLALVVAVAWILARRGTPAAEALVFVLVVLAVFLPVVLIWQTVLMLRAVRQMRDEALRLRAMAGIMREAVLQPRGTAPADSMIAAAPGKRPSPAMDQARQDEAQMAGKPQAAMAPFPNRQPGTGMTAPAPGAEAQADRGFAPMPFASRRAAAANRAGETDGSGGPAPLLRLENPEPTAVRVAVDDLIRALHFPESEDDAEGFAALRRALQDHATAELIRSAQTVLSGLAEDGIFLDQIPVDRARPELWRAFILGARGQAVSALGGIRDRSCLALTMARMRGDPAFRDAAHRFLRAFDQRLSVVEPQASDTQIARMAETRSARAFMLLGRLTGVFG